MQGGLNRIRQTFRSAPLIVKILLVVLLCVLAVPFAAFLILSALVYAPFAVWAGNRTLAASLSVAVWGMTVVSALAHGTNDLRYALVALPLAVVAAAHLGSLGRWFVPCRTVAWALLWSLPAGGRSEERRVGKECLSVCRSRWSPYH